MFNRFFIGTVTIMLLYSCALMEEKEVTITRDYVINPNWTEQNNSIEIYRMAPKDSTVNINPLSTNYIELSNSLTKDDGYSFVANVDYNGEDYSQRKVYFDKENSFVWRKPPDLDLKRENEIKTIGQLELETWYLFGGLSNAGNLYFIYFDSTGNAYRFKKLASNW